jgi:hypothetical protein
MTIQTDLATCGMQSRRVHPVAVWGMAYGIADSFSRNPLKIAGKSPRKSSCAFDALALITMVRSADDHASVI